MKTNVLKKLGLGASVFACLMSTGAYVNAAESTVTFNTMGSNTETGGGTNGGEKWFVTVPKTMEISEVGVATYGEVTIETINGADIDTAYDNLIIKVAVTSDNSFKLTGSNSPAETISYKLKDEGADITSNGEFNSLLGTGVSSSNSNATAKSSITISAEIEKANNIIEADVYRDTLTFVFNEIQDETEVKVS